MSKKVSEFDRYERMRKLEKEAEAEKRKSAFEGKKKSGRPKVGINGGLKHRMRDFDDYEDEYI